MRCGPGAVNIPPMHHPKKVLLAALLASLLSLPACKREHALGGSSAPRPVTGPAPSMPAQPMPPSPPPPSAAGLPPGDDGEAEPQGLPAGHPKISGKETSGELLQKIEQMKAELASKPKTLEIQVALGNLYYENQRYLDAIGYYKAAIEQAEPEWKKLDALPPPKKGEKPSEAAKKACTRTEKAQFQALIAEADAAAKKGDAAAARYCYREALAPTVVARSRRANSFFLAGNSDQAIGEHELVLARDPVNAESLFYLGAILFDSADGDVKKLERARATWEKLLQADPKNPRAEVAKKNLPELAALIKNGGKPPPGAAGPAGQGPMGEPNPHAGVPGMGGAPMPGAVNAGAAESIENVDVNEPGFLEAAEKQIAEGETLMDAGRWQEAREMVKGFMPIFMTKAPESPLFPRVLTDMGIIYVALGNQQMGPQMLEMALGKDPRYQPALDALAAMKAGRPMPKVAKGRSVAAAGKDWKAVAADGEAQFKKGNFGSAIDRWNEVIAGDPYLAGELKLKARVTAAQKKIR